MAFKVRERNPALADLRAHAARESHRIHELPDRFMGRALRALSRRARAELGSPYDTPTFEGYGAATLWAVLTGLASRLGEQELSPDERRGADSLPHIPERLRKFVGLCLANSEIPMKSVLREDAIACRILSQEFVNGNPITSALDRLAPPRADGDDWIVRHMREISRARFGHSNWISWAPEFNLFKGDRTTELGKIFDDCFDEVVEDGRLSTDRPGM